MPSDWARTGRWKDRSGKQIFFPHWHPQNPKRAKATWPKFHEECR